MMKEVYVCVTLYHLYITLLLINKKGNIDDCVILLNANDAQIYKQFCHLQDRLIEKGYKVDCRLRNKIKDIIGLEEIENKKQYKRVQAMLQSKLDNDFIMYNFAWNCQYIYSTATIYYKRCQYAYLMEEGAMTAINPPQPSYKIFLRKITGGAVEFFKDEKLKGIYVQKPEMYPNEWQNKLKELDVNDLEKHLTDRDKKIITDIFADGIRSSLINSEVKKVGIIYTQPLSEDGYISEEDKKTYYTQMVDYYKAYGTPILKLHPRDKSDYHLEDACCVLAANFPSEVLNLMDVNFEYAVGICTSAVPNTNAKYRLNINNDFLTDKVFELKPLV